MSQKNRILFACFLVTVLFASVKSQALVDSRADQKSRAITASVFEDRIRITGDSSVVAIHVAVFGVSGEKILEQEVKHGNVFDWQLQPDRQMSSGRYVWVVTTKSVADKLERRLGFVNVVDKTLTLQPGDLAQLSTAQAASIGSLDEISAWVVVENQEDPTTAVVAHDGTDGQITRGRGAFSFRLGNFFSGKDREQMRLTEEGNLGIGTSTPQAQLDVAGTIRAGKGFSFSDGSILNVTDKGLLSLTNADGTIVPNIAGTGTQNKLAKWIDNSATLGDSVVAEANGNIGIGNANPGSLLHIGGFAGYGATTGLLLGNNLLGSQFDRALQVAPVQTANPGQNSILIYALPTVNAGVTVPRQYGFFVDGRQGAGAVTAYAALATGQGPSLNATNNTHLLMGQLNIPTGNFGIFDATGHRNFFKGDVGIGTSAPAKHLHVLGTSDQEIAIESSDAGGRQWTLQSSRGSNGGRFEIVDRTAPANRFTILSNGKVGVGTVLPNSRFEVVDGSSQMRFGDTSADVGGYLTSTTTSEAVISGGARFNGSAWIPAVSQASMTSMLNGEIKFFTDRLLTAGQSFIPSERMRITNTGSVGIGGQPQNPFSVIGDGTITGGEAGANEVVARFMQNRAATHSALSIDAPNGQDSMLYLAEQGAARWDIRNDSSATDSLKFRAHDGSGGSSTQMTILQNGNVGIGTTGPSNQLHVVGNIGFVDATDIQEHIVRIVNSSANGTTGTSPGVLMLELNNIGTPAHANNYISFVTSGGGHAGAIEGNGDGGIELGGPGSDYAEWLPRVNAGEQIQRGDIVGLYAGHVTRQTRGATQVMAVSTGSIVAGNDPGEKLRSQHELIAFIGQVKVRVRGTVKAGDFVVASGLDDGIGVAVSPERITPREFAQVVGQAWESSSDSGVKSIRIAVGLNRHDPTVNRLVEFTRTQAARIASLESRLNTFEASLKSFLARDRRNNRRAGRRTALNSRPRGIGLGSGN